MGQNNTTLNRDFGTWDEEGIYKDRGCLIHPQCLTCPLPVCAYDLDVNPSTLKGYFMRARNYKLIKFAKNATHLAELANLDIRSAYRILALYRQVNGDYVKFLGIDADNLTGSYIPLKQLSQVDTVSSAKHDTPLKICSQCHIEKPLTSFNKKYAGKQVRAECKSCRAVYTPTIYTPVTSKLCTQCNTIKASDHFSVDRHKKSGLTSWCKDCLKAYKMGY